MAVALGPRSAGTTSATPRQVQRPSTSIAVALPVARSSRRAKVNLLGLGFTLNGCACAVAAEASGSSDSAGAQPDEGVRRPPELKTRAERRFAGKTWEQERGFGSVTLRKAQHKDRTAPPYWARLVLPGAPHWQLMLTPDRKSGRQRQASPPRQTSPWERALRGSSTAPSRLPLHITTPARVAPLRDECARLGTGFKGREVSTRASADERGLQEANNEQKESKGVTQENAEVATITAVEQPQSRLPSGESHSESVASRDSLSVCRGRSTAATVAPCRTSTSAARGYSTALSGTPRRRPASAVSTDCTPVGVRDAEAILTQTDRQTDRHTHTDTHRHTQTHIGVHVST